MEALKSLEMLGGLDQPELNLTRIENFINAHRNPDGGFWDEEYTEDGMTSTMKCTSKAINALGIINGHQGKNFESSYIINVASFVDSSLSSVDGGYSDKPGEKASEIYGTYNAFNALWWLGGNNETEKLDFVEGKMSLEKITDYIIKKYQRSGTGAFAGYIHEIDGNVSLHGTYAAVRFFENSGQTKALERLPILHFIMDQKAGPGQYGRDMYSTYAAVEIFTMLDCPTLPMDLPEKEKIITSAIQKYYP